MMRNVVLLILACFVERVPAKVREVNRAGQLQDGLADRVVESLVDNFFNQALKAPTRHHADLGNTTLGQPASIAAAPSSRVARLSKSVSHRYPAAGLRFPPSSQWRGGAALRGHSRARPIAKVAESFEPGMPEGTLQAFLGTTGILLGAGGIWWNEVIPQKREEVMKSKRQGEIKEYLEDLIENENSTESSQGFQRWLFTDWVRQAKREGGAKPAALPFLKKAKWNSGDNPVLVAFGGIMALVLASSLAERGADTLR